MKKKDIQSNLNCIKNSFNESQSLGKITKLKISENSDVNFTEFDYLKFKLAKILRFFSCKTFTLENYNYYKSIIKNNEIRFDFMKYLDKED